MDINRRHFLLFLGAGMGSAAFGSLPSTKGDFSMPFQGRAIAATSEGLSFNPIQGPMPLVTDGLTAAQQLKTYAQFTVVDDLVLPEGFTYDVIAAWGDRVGDSRFGYNNDYLSYVETAPGEGYLTVNFEYISDIPWVQAFEQVLNKPSPLDGINQAAQETTESGINAYALPETDPLKAQIRSLVKEALIDQGMGVIGIRKTQSGQWERTFAEGDRRITGISGLEDGRYLQVTGPARTVFQKTTALGYQDGLGDRIIGTFGNCAGGTTPWGTVLSAEENFQDLVPEPVHADGSAFDPKLRPFEPSGLSGQGNVFGLAGNKYGWIVEVAPSNPSDYGTKHSWLGRYRHEAVGIRVEAGQPLAFYSGCDRRGGHLYKFVSQDPVETPTDKANSRLLEQGTLSVARFNADGSGQWVPLNADTPVNPDDPSHLASGVLLLPPCNGEGAYRRVTTIAEVTEFQQQYATLGAIYQGTSEEKQGAILIDAHYAANAVGGTCTARPEATVIGSDGALLITFTSGTPERSSGPDNRIFKGPKGELGYEYGWIMRLTEDQNAPAAMTFRWEMIATGGEPADGGVGFSNPDNLAVDASGHLWIVTDMSTEQHNRSQPERWDGMDKRGLFGNNGIWFMPTRGPQAGQAFLFGMGPMECEATGPFFTPDQQTLFLAIQHPGEINGMRENGAVDTRLFAMATPDGQPFQQTRTVPVGSNWPSKGANNPPKPAVVAIRRLDQGSIPGSSLT